jgi:aspartate/glutamate racemase
MVTRLLHFGEIIEAKDALTEWIKPGNEEGALSVSEAVILACASARLIVENDHIRYDIGDVARIAKRYDDEEAATGAKQHG